VNLELGWQQFHCSPKYHDNLFEKKKKRGEEEGGTAKRA
jgi:hypothetical protein